MTNIKEAEQELYYFTEIARAMGNDNVNHIIELAQQHLALLKAIESGRLAVVPVEPSKQMLIYVGTMDGYDGASSLADSDHIEWWQAVIQAAPSLDELLKGE